MDVNHVQSALCFPTFPRFCGQTFTEAKDRELGLLGVRAYNDWMVEEWCGPEAAGPAHPADPHPAVGRGAGRRRGAPQRRPRGARRLPSPRSRRTWACRPSTPDDWDPFLAACDETGTVIAMHIGSSSQYAVDLGRRPAGRRLHDHLRQLLLLDGRLADERQVRALPEPQDHVRGGPDRLDPVHPGARRRGLGGEPRLGRRRRQGAAGRRPSCSPSTSTAASSTTPSGCGTSTRSGSATSCTRRTTRTPTRPGRSPARSARRRWATWRRTWWSGSCGATRSSCWG